MKTEKEPVVYEYAGFKYRVVGVMPNIILVPVAGQHTAAKRLKNIMNARQMYLQQQAERK